MPSVDAMVRVARRMDQLHHEFGQVVAEALELWRYDPALYPGQPGWMDRVSQHAPPDVVKTITQLEALWNAFEIKVGMVLGMHRSLVEIRYLDDQARAKADAMRQAVYEATLRELAAPPADAADR